MTLPRITHETAVPPRPSPPKNRLEELVGADLARLLVSALAGYRGRPDLGRGPSSP